uniref:NADH-ubiquinone oxidoreductase chain 2 n=1 Tax=Tropidomya abbreviata TaxID=102404 RepID=A0A1U9XPK5_9BIVA|nr:NADH dehydrogenase subunit 2 [Tropidomya abbreviata]AQZ26174.1 NADH dehydrogenase subunit 2 [Tropidomya abbreviata]
MIWNNSFLIYPSHFCFFMIIWIGAMISVSSAHWLGVWLGMELNLFGMIPLLIGKGQGQEIEAAIKYYFIQSVGSCFIIIGLLLNNLCLSIFLMEKLFFMVGLVMKLGIVPFYFWVPSVMEKVSWISCFLLCSIQKVSPLFLLINIFQMENLFIVMGCLSSVVGGVGGFNQSKLRSMLAYSSIGHGGWMVGGLMMSIGGALSYFISYFFTCLIVFSILSVLGIFEYSQISKSLSAGNSTIFYLLSLGFLGMSGIPPFIMFFGKVIVISSFCTFFLGILMFLLGAIISMYYYFNVMMLWSIVKFNVLIFNEGKSSFGLLVLMSIMLISGLWVMLILSNGVFF